MRAPELFSFIPAPGDWGARYRLYGIMIAIGVIAGLELARRRWAARGGNPEDISAIALWAVPAGLIGARLYHVITDNEIYRGHWFDNPFGTYDAAGNVLKSPLAIWQGGLGIPGGIILGTLVGIWAARRRGMRIGPAMDAVAPSLPLAQAIGRWGNYFNQELFGRPTELPWALEVSPLKRPAEFENFATFHPTFLYEMLWNIGVVLFLIWFDQKRIVRPGRIFWLYVFGYFLGRLWVEALRSDSANTILGLRVNIWTSLVAMGLVLVIFAVGGFRRRPGDSDEPYRDGRRWDPVNHVLVGGAPEATEVTEATGATVPDSGAEGVAQRASGGNEVAPEGDS